MGGSGMERENVGRLIVSCPDRHGIVAAVSAFLAEAGANIVSSDQYSSDPEGGAFFLRMAFHLEGLRERQAPARRPHPAVCDHRRNSLVSPRPDETPAGVRRQLAERGSRGLPHRRAGTAPDRRATGSPRRDGTPSPRAEAPCTPTHPRGATASLRCWRDQNRDAGARSGCVANVSRAGPAAAKSARAGGGPRTGTPRATCRGPRCAGAGNHGRWPAACRDRRA